MYIPRFSGSKASVLFILLLNLFLTFRTAGAEESVNSETPATGAAVDAYGEAETSRNNNEAADKTAGPGPENTEANQPEQLVDITVQATRVDNSLYEIPAAVGYVNKDDTQLGRQELGLDESLNKIPGVFMQNRYNFNQDLSISIRGFGKRSSFGVRGLRIYVDGIPSTLPDGQSNIDNIDLGSTDHIEVIRGPSSSLYGPSAGGVINLYTEDGPVDTPFIEGWAGTGSFGFKRFQVKAGGQAENLNYLLNLSRLDYDGYRDHARIERTLLNSKFRYEFDNTSDLTVTANILDKPTADDPGGLTRAQYDTNRRQAQFNNSSARFDAGESAEQQQFGFAYRKTFGDYHELWARNYYLFRDFDAKLPIGQPITTGGIIELNRFVTGGGLQYSYSAPLFGHHNRFTTGFDIDAQMDERKTFDNFLGTPTDTLRLNQDEDVSTWGVYLRNDFAITGNLNLVLGIRYDEVDFDFTDHFLSDGDQSGKPRFDEWSPQAGFLWKLHNAVNVYGNISTSFETPTTREFAAPPPAGPGGFNTDLVPQTSTNYEIGVKGVVPGRVSYQLALFRIDTENEILPAGLNFGSTYYTNTGETRRLGLEAGTTFQPLAGLDVTLAYTYSNFEFEKLIVNGMSFKGEKIPGIPEQNVYAEIAYYNPSGFFGVFDAQYVDNIYVNNAFIKSNPPALVPQGEITGDYAVFNFRAGYTALMGNTEFTPFFGVNNITNRKYVGNVRINEGNLRFYEAAPELNIFAGISLNFR